MLHDHKPEDGVDRRSLAIVDRWCKEAVAAGRRRRTVYDNRIVVLAFLRRAGKSVKKVTRDDVIDELVYAKAPATKQHRR